MIEPTPNCCAIWPRILHKFGWMQFDDDPQLLTMPYLSVNDNLWRINHCPSCGKEVRECIITRATLDQARAGD